LTILFTFPARRILVKILSQLYTGILMACPSIALGDDAKKEEAKIDGTWLAKKAELAGKEFPKQVVANLKLTLNKGDYEVQAESPDRGIVTYDDSAMPKKMDIKGVEGPNKGKTILAIYELSGDTLKICYDLSGKEHPTEFKTLPKSRLFLVTYERQKPDESKPQ
jgi:uncharacterized protein (TIGR03067 family)